MNSYQYDKPLARTYFLAAVATSAAVTLLTGHGPADRKGRIAGVSTRVSTAITVADVTLTVQIKGGAVLTTLVLPFTGSAVDDIVSQVAEQLKGSVEIQEGEVVEVVSDGGSTAGNVDVVLDIDWY